MKTALIVDHDLGFLFWLADALCAAGYVAYPAESAAATESLLSDLPGGIDLAIVNPELPQAGSLVSTLSRLPSLPNILALSPEPDEAESGLPGVTAWLGKPDAQDEAARSAWREALLRHLGVAP